MHEPFIIMEDYKMPKVKFGLKNTYYAPAIIATAGTASYSTPKKLPGAVSLTFDPAGEQITFYADDVAYFVAGGNTGYTGSLELALITDDFRKDCLGEDSSETGVLIEVSDAVSKPFALLFEFTTDDKAQKYVLYNCVASRPNISGNTKAESTEVSTETINITASSIYNEELDANIVKAKADNTASAYANWYSAVWQPTASPSPEPGEE